MSRRLLSYGVHLLLCTVLIVQGKLNVTQTTNSVNTTTPLPEVFTTTEAPQTTPTEIATTEAISSGYLNRSVERGNSDNPEEVPAFPFPPTFFLTGTGNEGLEETFTYQVKKQRKSPKSKTPHNSKPDESSLMQDQARGKSDYEAMQIYVSNLNRDMSSKIRDISNSIQTLNYGVKSNSSAFNSTLYYLNQEIRNLTTLSKETSHLVKVIQHTQEQERIAFLNQLSNLTDRIDRLQHDRIEENNRITTAISRLQMKLENTSQEVRVHDIHLRYGQQVMTSMKNSIEKNVERITGLETDGGPQWVEQTVGCGGVVIANSGIVSYKYRQPYLNNERCVWIIRANRRMKINLQVLDDGFQNQSNSDYLTVTEFAEDSHPVTLLTSTRLEHGNKATHTFQGPVIFVTFYSDASSPGTGFTLKFEGVGNRTDGANINTVRYTNRHIAEPSGIFTHPVGFGVNPGTTYQPNELVTLAINPPNAGSVRIQMKMSDLEKDEYCEFDSVSFYGSVTGSYALTKRYCQQGEKMSGEIIQSSEGIFLVIFRSDASTQFSGFQFTWNSD